MTRRALRDWWIFFLGGVLSCFGLTLLGTLFVVFALALRAEDWMKSKEIFIHLRKRR